MFWILNDFLLIIRHAQLLGMAPRLVIFGLSLFFWLHPLLFFDLNHSMEKVMAPHSSVLAWRIPGMGAPRGLPSLGSHRVEHDWSNLAAAAAVHLYYTWQFPEEPKFFSYLHAFKTTSPSIRNALVLPFLNLSLNFSYFYCEYSFGKILPFPVRSLDFPSSAYTW